MPAGELRPLISEILATHSDQKSILKKLFPLFFYIAFVVCVCFPCTEETLGALDDVTRRSEMIR